MQTDNKLQAEGTFEKMKGFVQEKWGEFTDDELQELKGNWNQFVGTIRKKTGETVESVERRFNDLFDRDDK